MEQWCYAISSLDLQIEMRGYQISFRCSDLIQSLADSSWIKHWKKCCKGKMLYWPVDIVQPRSFWLLLLSLISNISVTLYTNHDEWFSGQVFYSESVFGNGKVFLSFCFPALIWTCDSWNTNSWSSLPTAVRIFFYRVPLAS